MTNVKKIKDRGFIDLHIATLLVVIVLAIGGIGYYVVSHSNKKKSLESALGVKNSSSQQALSSSGNNNSAQALSAIVDPTATGGASIKASTSNTPTTTGAGRTSSATTSTTTIASAPSKSSSNSTNTSSNSTKSSSSSSTVPYTFLVTGTFTEYPTKPVCSVTMPCSAPISNHVVDVYYYCDPAESIPCSSKPLMATTTNSKGQFSLHLAKGHYTLMLNPQIGLNSQSWSFKEQGQAINLQLTDDSGIR